MRHVVDGQDKEQPKTYWRLEARGDRIDLMARNDCGSHSHSLVVASITKGGKLKLHRLWTVSSELLGIDTGCGDEIQIA